MLTPRTATTLSASDSGLQLPFTAAVHVLAKLRNRETLSSRAKTAGQSRFRRSEAAWERFQN